MKLLMIMAPTECLEDLQNLVKSHDVQSYTELPNLLGAGASGGHMGTRAFPGTSSIFMTIVEAPVAEKIAESIRSYCEQPETCNQVRVFAMPAEQLV